MYPKIAVFFAALIFLTSPASAEKRVALVIGNGAYRNAPSLPNPHNDAEDVAAALKRTGFDVIVGLDLDKAKMDETLIEFIQRGQLPRARRRQANRRGRSSANDETR
jgi:caspase domain-containing protein